jgi:hypothetical protein
VPLQSIAGVIVNCVLSIVTATDSLLLSALKVNVSPSTSLDDTVIVNGVSSAVLVSSIDDMTGASFTGIMVIETVPVSENTPSERMNVKESSPL